MKISQIPSLLETCHKAGISVLLKGAPGTAKTAAVRQYAKQAKLKLIHIHGPLTDQLDIKGLPTVANGEAKFLPLNIWPEETDAPVIVLIDELPQCVPTIQNAYSQLLIDHKIGGTQLPKGSFVVATGNRREDKAATSNIPSHIVNRVLHVTVDCHAEDFLDWAIINKIDPMIIAFGRFQPNNLHTFDPKNTQEPYATYRTWEKASDFIKVCKDDTILYEALSGLVGPGPTGEFIAFKRLYMDLPDPQTVLANPELAIIPNDPAILYALTTACATACENSQCSNLIRLAERLPTEYAVLMIRTARKILPSLAKAEGMRDWAMKNKDVIL